MPNLNVESLARLPQPLLTVYVDTNPGDRENQRHVPAYLTWLKTEARALMPDLPATERKLFLKQLRRVESLLREHSGRRQALLIFAGSKTWKQMSLDLPLSNELHWGGPALSQLLAILDGQQPSCVVAVTLAGARFFRYQLGKMTEFPEQKFEIDTSQWKKKDHAHMARRGTRLPHGAQRDVFQQRMDAQYRRASRELAERINTLCAKENPSSIFLVGSKRLTEPLERELSREYRERTALIAEELGNLSPSALKRQLAPRMAAWMKEFTGSRIRHLLAGDPGTVVGIDETLARIQSGAVGKAMLAYGLEAMLRKCVQCGLTSRSADPVCSACGGARQDVLLSEALPELARANQTELEVVNDEAARELIESGGMGGWLRKPRREYEVPGASGRL